MNDSKKSNLTDFKILLYVLPKPNDYAPDLSQPVDPLTVPLYEDLIYKLPKVQDQDGDVVKSFIDLQNASTFVKFKDGVFKIQPSSIDQIGNYTVLITLVDDGYPVELSSKISFLITVTPAIERVFIFVNETKKEKKKETKVVVRPVVPVNTQFDKLKAKI